MRTSILASLFALALLASGATPARAQRSGMVGNPRICDSATIDRAVQAVAGSVREGYGSRGVCSFHLYTGVNLDNQEAVTARAREVFASRKEGVCLHAQLNEAYQALGMKPKGWSESWYCDRREYNDGQWGSLEELVGHVRARLANPRRPNHGSPQRPR
jgi:hypothetical protein